jgi:hypothetical protein
VSSSYDSRLAIFNFHAPRQKRFVLLQGKIRSAAVGESQQFTSKSVGRNVQDFTREPKRDQGWRVTDPPQSFAFASALAVEQAQRAIKQKGPKKFFLGGIFTGRSVLIAGRRRLDNEILRQPPHAVSLS